MFALISRLVTRFPRQVAIAFLVIGVVGAFFGASVEKDLAAAGLEDPGSEAVAASKALMDTIGVGDPDLMLVVGSKEKPIDQVAPETSVTALVTMLKADPAVRRVTSPLDKYEESLVSEDKTRALVLVELKGSGREKADALERLVPEMQKGPLPVLIGGPTAAERIAQQLAMTDLAWAELLALPVVAILLLLFFRGPFAAALPLAVGVVAIPVAFAVLRVLTHFTEVSIFALNVGSFIGTGLSIDYAMVLVQRFRDEVALGAKYDEAVDRMLHTSGRAIVVSGLTVAGSMLALLVFPLGLLRSIGIAGALVVMCAMGVSLILLPALLMLLGSRIGKTTQLPQSGGTWARIADAVMARPILVTVGVLAVLGMLASPTLRLKTIMPDVNTFPADTDVRIVDGMLDDPTGFGAENHTPILALVRTQGDVIKPENTAAVVAWIQAVKALPGVSSVQSPFASGSFTDPKIAKTFLANPFLMPSELRWAVQATTKGDFTVVKIVPVARWRTNEAAAMVETVRGVHTPDVTTLVGGPTAMISDARAAMSKKLPLALALIVGVNLVLLFVAFGSVVVPIKAVLMNIASIGASFGALVWSFQDAHLAGLLGFEPPGGIDLTVPVIMFAIVFGLSTDYEVFLLSRIKEEMDRTGDNEASVREGLEKTGSIITRAAALLIVVVIGFAAGRFLFIQEMGVGMVVAIFIDATIVRALLVPATMVLLGNANWWAPAPLKRLWVWLDMEVRE